MFYVVLQTILIAACANIEQLRKYYSILNCTAYIIYLFSWLLEFYATHFPYKMTLVNISIYKMTTSLLGLKWELPFYFKYAV